MAGTEITPRHKIHRVEGELEAGVEAGDALPGGLLPPGLGAAVPHDQVAVAEVPRYPEGHHFAIYRAFEGDAGVTQRAVGDGEWHSAHHVVGDLVSGQHLQRIGLGFVAYLDHQHRLGRLEPLVGLVHTGKAGRIERRDAILGDAAGEHLAVGNDVPTEVGAELTGASWRRLLRQ